MTLYLTLFFGVSLFGWYSNRHNYKKFNKGFFVIVLLILTFFVGLRDVVVGADTTNYIDYFDNLNLSNFNNFNIEIGFKFYNLFFNSFIYSYQVFFLITAFFTFYGFMRFIKDNSFIPWLSMIVLIAMFFLPSMNLMRQWLAMSIGLNMFQLLDKKKYLLAFLLLIFAVLIHNTAIVLIILPILFIMKKSKINLIISIIIISIFTIFFDQIFSLILIYLPEHYYEYIFNPFFINQGEMNIKTIAFLIVSIGMLFIVYRNKNQLKLEGYFDKAYIFLILSIFGVAVTYLGQYYYMLHRLGYYITAFYIVSFVNMIHYLKRYRSWLYFMMILSVLVIYIYTLLADNNSIVPYILKPILI